MRHELDDLARDLDDLDFDEGGQATLRKQLEASNAETEMALLDEARERRDGQRADGEVCVRWSRSNSPRERRCCSLRACGAAPVRPSPAESGGDLLQVFRWDSQELFMQFFSRLQTYK